MESDDPFLMPTDELVSDSVLLVMSHVIILLAIINALVRRLFYVSSSTAGMLINSVQYHLCRANWSCGIYGVPLAYDSSSLALYRSRVVDHASANHNVVSILFAVLTSDPSGGPTAGGLRILLAIGAYSTEFAFPLKNTALALTFVCLMAVMSVYTWLSIKGKLPDASRFGMGLLVAALVVLGVGYAMFEANFLRYGIAHSIWHACVGIAVFLITEGIHIGRGNTSWLARISSTCCVQKTGVGII